MSGNEVSTEGAEISAGMEVWINHRNFPSNLWHLVTDPQICSICWDDTGEGILICPEAFKAEVLSTANKKMNKYFRTTNFISFVRQLNLYGFRKVCPDYKISLTKVSFIQHFYNPNFKRANPELLVNLKRLTPSNRAKLAAGPEVSTQSCPSHDPMLNSPESSAVVENHCCILGSLDSNMPCSQQEDHSFSQILHTGPGSLDSNMPCSQQEVASDADSGCYPDHSFSQILHTVQNPKWQSADASDPRKSHMNLDTVFDVEDQMEAAAFFTLLTDVDL
ncbi:heat stress transcription factor B-2b-like isoform X2 [Tachysurus fulvidraco]|uniref:heat stress transcription factor B-2b-like isoform X2 n=1 Tax=Tachysurus fulvidraco TaxID=1234273 RepID=UPI000F4E8FD7|nr:heat stress transcription factor B-2b-like isoform X2 [Tachysurus fulvidraco]